MKTYIIIFLAFVGLLLACSEDSEFSNNPPRIEIVTPSVSGAVGETVTFSARLEDDYVLKYADLTSNALDLNERVYISIKNSPVNASGDVIKSVDDFSFDYTIPSLAVSGKSYEILFEVKNVTGQISTGTFTLNAE